MEANGVFMQETTMSVQLRMFKLQNKSRLY